MININFHNLIGVKIKNPPKIIKKFCKEEFYYFISGQGKMWVGTETFEIKPGDAVMAPPDLDHGFENTGDKTLKLAIIWGKPEE